MSLQFELVFNFFNNKLLECEQVVLFELVHFRGLLGSLPVVLGLWLQAKGTVSNHWFHLIHATIIERDSRVWLRLRLLGLLGLARHWLA